NNIGVEADGADTLTLKLAEKVDLGTDGSVTTGNTVVNNSGITIAGGTNDVHLGNDGLDNGGNKITHVADGTDDTDVVNVGQLEDVETTANKGWNYVAGSDTSTSTNVGPGESVEFGNSDDNIVVSNTSEGMSFDLANSITVGPDSSGH